MPSKINLYQIGVWFCVGFFTSAGWAIAALFVGRILSAVQTGARFVGLLRERRIAGSVYQSPRWSSAPGLPCANRSVFA
jgi:hypothetical protein